MTLPALDEHGFLPAGFHDCSLDDIRETFCYSVGRHALFDLLLKYLEGWRSSGLRVPVYVDGGFATRKPQEPKDIDVVVDITKLDLLDPAVVGTVQRLLDELFADELPWAQAMDNSDLVMRLKGPAADEEAPRVKLIADTFDSLRDQIQKIAKSIAGVTSSSRGFPEDLDLGLSAFARGSVVLGLRVRTSDTQQASLLDQQDPLLLATRDAVRRLGEVARFVSDDKLDDDALKSEFPDPGVRDTILGAAAKLAPTGKKGIDSVELTVPERAGQQLVMTPKTRTTISRL